MPAATSKPHSPPPKKAVLVVFPAEVVVALDAIAKREDTDRSKFIRKAVRNAIRGL